MAALNAALARCAGLRGTHGVAARTPQHRPSRGIPHPAGRTAVDGPGRPRTPFRPGASTPSRGQTVRRSAPHGTRGAAARGARHPRNGPAGAELLAQQPPDREPALVGRAVRAAALPRRAFRPFGRRRGLRKPTRTGPPDGRPDVRRRHGGRLHPAPPPDGPPLDEPRLRRAGLRRGRRGIRVRGHGEQPRNPAAVHLGRGFPRRTRRGRDPIGDGADRPPGTLRHPARIRDRRLRAGRKRRPGAERRPLGGIRLPGTTPDGIWNE